MVGGPVLEELCPGVVVTYSPQPTSYTGVVSMVVGKAEGVMVLDAGVAESMPDAVVPALRALDVDLGDITAICCTHGHFDHAGGSRLLRDIGNARIHLSTHDLDLVDFQPDESLEDGDQLDLGDLVFDVIGTPGHTPGSVCFYETTRRILIVGDAVQGSGSAEHGLLPVYFQSGRAYRASLRRLLDLPVDILVMGHPLEWTEQASCVHRGPACQRLLAESLEAATIIESAVAETVSKAAELEFSALRLEILTRLTRHPLFARFDPHGPIGASTDATLRSELRDLGVVVP